MKTSFETMGGKYVIPSGTTRIGDYEFLGCEDLREVVIPDTVTCIGRSAFDGCRNLIEINIPESVRTIEEHAFFGCWSLTEIKLPASVQNIGYGAFSGCIEVETVKVEKNNPVYMSVSNCCLSKDGKTLVFGCKSSVIPRSVVTIGEAAFLWSEGLAGITIPDSVREIESMAFYGCLSLRKVAFPENGRLERIGADSFSNCTALRVVTIPITVKEIGVRAFAECHRLWAVSLPDTITRIEEGLFFKCRTLGKFTIPSSVTEIRRFAFCGCHGLDGLVIPPSVTTVYSRAFHECGRFEEVRIPDTVSYLGQDVSCLYVPKEIKGDDSLTYVGGDEFPFLRKND